MKREVDILLLRAPSRPIDPYERAFALAGLVARSVAVLTYNALGERELADALQRIDQFAGIILTSPRAARRLSDELKDGDFAAVRGVPVYCVGPSTERPLGPLGLTTEVLGLGTAATLARSIPLPDDGRPLLFLSGASRRDELPTILRERGVRLEELPVYASVPIGAEEIAGVERPDWVAFFSPSGVAAVAGSTDLSLRGAKRAAIGPTTAEALRKLDVPPHAVADSPTPEALVRAVLTAENEFNRPAPDR